MGWVVAGVLYLFGGMLWHIHIMSIGAFLRLSEKGMAISQPRLFWGMCIWPWEVLQTQLSLLTFKSNDKQSDESKK